MAPICSKHCFEFNDDAFEVCTKCGICSSLREMVHEYHVNDEEVCYNMFRDVLVNNHLGFEIEIEKEYSKIKSVMKRGYPNISLYAYCTYITLLHNSVYYSLAQISQMFQLRNFKRQFCQIDRSYTADNIKYDDNDEIYMRSAMKIFLSKHNLIKYLSRCMIMSRDVKTHLTNTKLPFIVSISIYCVMFEEKLSSKEIIEKLCSYFIINPRTLEKKIRQFKQKK